MYTHISKRKNDKTKGEKKRDIGREKRITCEDKGRDWNSVSSRQQTPRSVRI
jgi:hypothetical protein